MSPFNQSSSDQRIGINYSRRRPNAHTPSADAPSSHHPFAHVSEPAPLSNSNSSNAIAAAEAAASSILYSDNSDRKGVRSRGGSTTHASIDSGADANSNNNGRSSMIFAGLRRTHANLMQRRQQRPSFRRFKRCELSLMILVTFAIVTFLLESEHDIHKLNDKPRKYGGKRTIDVVSSANINEKNANALYGNNNSPGKQHKKVHEAAEKRRPPKMISIDKIYATTTEGEQRIDSDTNNQQHQQAQGRNQHAIPPILIFTYHTNLLTTPESSLSDEEDVALSKNVHQIVSFHPESSVRFLSDEDCVNSIRATLGKETKLVEYFNKEEKGMYKADICRGAALYETGGLYFDIDIEARMPLWDVIDVGTEFVTTLVHKDSNHLGGFFQAFIGVTARHRVMKRYLEIFVEYYEGKVEVNGPLGVYFLRMAYDELSREEKAHSELWQEVRYHPKIFPKMKEPPPSKGTRRACQMLVVAMAKDFEGGRKREKTMIPFYSHARGSRMCGGKDTNKKG